MKTIEALARKQIQLGMSGSVTALRGLTRRKEKLDERDAARAAYAFEEERKKSELEAEENERLFQFMLKLQRSQKDAYAAADANNAQPAKLYPHPVDFIIDYDARSVNRRPMGLGRCEAVRALREGA